MGQYAKNTQVSADRSKAEIEKTLIRYGVEEFLYMRGLKGAGIGFTYKGREIKLNIPLPSRDEYNDNRTGELNWEKECRRLWRVLLLWIKANLELIESGMITFEDIFLAQTCLPNGQTVSQGLQGKLTKNNRLRENAKTFNRRIISWQRQKKKQKN